MPCPSSKRSGSSNSTSAERAAVVDVVVGDVAERPGASAHRDQVGLGPLFLAGGGGDDWLLGGADDDQIEGHDGDDTVEAGGGDDRVTNSGVIEGFERDGGAFLVGVQWHPEKQSDEASARLFGAFVEACRSRTAAG